MTPYTGGQGCNYTAISSNTTTNVGVVGATAASAAGLPAMGGHLHEITLGGDSTATTVTVYDNTAASGTPIAKFITQASFNPVTLLLDVQLKVGLTIVTSGMTSGVVTVAWV